MRLEKKMRLGPNYASLKVNSCWQSVLVNLPEPLSNRFYSHQDKDSKTELYYKVCFKGT